MTSAATSLWSCRRLLLPLLQRPPPLVRWLPARRWPLDRAHELPLFSRPLRHLGRPLLPLRMLHGLPPPEGCGSSLLSTAATGGFFNLRPAVCNAIFGGVLPTSLEGLTIWATGFQDANRPLWIENHDASAPTAGDGEAGRRVGFTATGCLPQGDSPAPAASVVDSGSRCCHRLLCLEGFSEMGRSRRMGRIEKEEQRPLRVLIRPVRQTQHSAACRAGITILFRGLEGWSDQNGKARCDLAP
ncbi:hypothetical protein COCNU_14G002210 [Cocos nucifera]|uniref:Uncharacterized protein n=1 Tax=Cocos nucifera TaxID=13894 RepID=A0A8K0NC07_COCNU|nr:hypothetical protein COCNU_14G002210 [Cocos nucifera]